MKRIISFMLSLMFLLSSLSMLVYAEEETDTETGEELTNVTESENALAYASSEKNTLWTPAIALIDGKKSEDTWQGWECGYPSIIYGSDTSAGFSGQYCGVKFTNKEYYEVHEIYLNLGMHAAMGGQNARFTVQCLVEGVWVTVADFHDSDTKPIAYESYEEAMEKDTSFYHIPSEYSFKLDTPVTTNNVRVTISEYGKNYPGGDVLIFPYIYEIEIYGRRGETPELELPEGAVISSNIGYHSYPWASSSASFKYPYLAIDGKETSGWAPVGKEAGEHLVLDFGVAKKINKAVVNFGTYMEGATVVDYKFNIEANINGEWVKVAEGTSFDEENKTLITEYIFDEVETRELRIIFTESYKRTPTVCEFEAHMSEEKTYYVEDRYDAYERSSASKGNLAIIGTPYASKDFAPYSDVYYIIDGKIDENASVWFTGVIDMPSYCGVSFSEPQLVDRVALYFYIPSEEGIDIMDIQIQALIDGEYKTLVTTKSYDSELKYAPAFKFEPVETTDIRILYTRGNGTFANLKEIEIYSPNGGIEMFDGLAAMAELPTFIDTTVEGDDNSGSNTDQTPDSTVDSTTDSTVDSGNNNTAAPKGGKNLTVPLIIAGVLVACAIAVIVYVVYRRQNSK